MADGSGLGRANDPYGVYQHFARQASQFWDFLFLGRIARLPESRSKVGSKAGLCEEPACKRLPFCVTTSLFRELSIDFPEVDRIWACLNTGLLRLGCPSGWLRRGPNTRPCGPQHRAYILRQRILSKWDRFCAKQPPQYGDGPNH